MDPLITVETPEEREALDAVALRPNLPAAAPIEPAGAPTPQAAEPVAGAEAKRLRDALVELTRLEPPETVPANIRVVVYGADARDYALQVLNAAPPQPAAAPEDAWRMAVDDALVNAGLDCTTGSSNPHECVKRLVTWVADMASDPLLNDKLPWPTPAAAPDDELDAALCDLAAWQTGGNAAAPEDAAGQGALKRWAINPDNGLLYEAARGPWVRYADHLAASSRAQQGAPVAMDELREQCARICDDEAAGFGGVVDGPIATERGKMLFEAMAAGAMTCAAAIRNAALAGQQAGRAAP